MCEYFTRSPCVRGNSDVILFIFSALALAHTAPDSEPLIVLYGPFQTLLANLTVRADTLRIARRTAFFRKERVGISLGTQCLEMPRHIVMGTE